MVHGKALKLSGNQTAGTKIKHKFKAQVIATWAFFASSTLLFRVISGIVCQRR